MKDSVSRIAAAAGLVLLLSGAAMYPVGTLGNQLPLSLFLAGIGVLAVTAIANLQKLISFFRRRSARHGANAALMILLFTAALIVIQAISMRNTYRYDVTKNKRFSLSQQTIELLKRIDSEVVITAFFRSTDSGSLVAANLLAMYTHHNRLIRYSLVDPDRKPHVAEVKRARHGQVVVEYRDSRRNLDGISEEKLTNAILLATRQRQKTAYFVTGHDEKRIDSNAGEGFSAARMNLEKLGYTSYPLSLLDVDSIPPDCAVLILAGPKKELLEPEVSKIDTYLAGGGSVLFLLDPRRPVGRIEPVLGLYHVAVDNIVLLDELVVVDAGEEVFDATYTKIRRYEPHEITRDFRTITIFPMARPLAVVPVEGNISVRAQYLAITEKSAWGETDMTAFTSGTATRDEHDVAPPLAVAVVAERTNQFDRSLGPGEPVKRSRIVVVGDSDFATNRFIGILGNLDFFLNAVEYLAREEIVVPIRLREGLGDRVFISAAEGRLVFVLCIVLLPLAVISWGGYVHLRKRRG
jgi:ABC-type uncharacterized transport system involved in gliding motility auxiliary subunit